ncbi:hypothetical protein HLH17_05400 [Acinetobacter sp. ANC 5380]|uniref:Pirin N-terminal domain-containing protein n=1 Tax=Acinetobacter terrae TaxID=2731247 RepID=A0A7Y2WA69_9GAMM|nr:hypothetical protein [Acinetobacter terrae]
MFKFFILHISQFKLLNSIFQQTSHRNSHLSGCLVMHPYRSFETVIIIYDAELEHRQSKGNHDKNW